MSDAKNRTRQPAGVPVGGEYAKEASASTGVVLGSAHGTDCDEFLEAGPCDCAELDEQDAVSDLLRAEHIEHLREGQVKRDLDSMPLAPGTVVDLDAVAEHLADRMSRGESHPHSARSLLATHPHLVPTPSGAHLEAVISPDGLVTREDPLGVGSNYRRATHHPHTDRLIYGADHEGAPAWAVKIDGDRVELSEVDWNDGDPRPTENVLLTGNIATARSVVRGMLRLDEDVTRLQHRLTTLTPTEAQDIFMAYLDQDPQVEERPHLDPDTAAWNQVDTVTRTVPEPLQHIVNRACQALIHRPRITEGTWTRQAYDADVAPLVAVLGKLHPDD